jgi:hypothetical protein
MNARHDVLLDDRIGGSSGNEYARAQDLCSVARSHGRDLRQGVPDVANGRRERQTDAPQNQTPASFHERVQTSRVAHCLSGAAHLGKR